MNKAIKQSIKPPALLLAMALLFWGWQTKLFLLAILMALLVEAAHFVHSRWFFSNADVQRTSNLCTILLLGMFAYLLIASRPADALLLLFQWMPLALYPLILLQAYCATDTVDLRTLFAFSNKHYAFVARRPLMISLFYPYFVLCIFAASAANSRGLLFYPAVAALGAWTLWPVRASRFPAAVWIGMLALAAVAGAIEHVALNNLQSYFEGQTTEWFSRWFRAAKDSDDSYRNFSEIGEVGPNKLSSRILFRVELDSPSADVILLKRAEYDTLSDSSVWISTRNGFYPIVPINSGTTWQLAPTGPIGLASIGAGGLRRASIFGAIQGRKALLALPPGTSTVTGLEVTKIWRNAYGAVMLEQGPGYTGYSVSYSSAISVECDPDLRDLTVPRENWLLTERVVNELDLRGRKPRDVMNRVSHYFLKQFSYSLDAASGIEPSRLLTAFLLERHSGHCELFATATVLILRAAGIPARYAVGYATTERALSKNMFVVRERHSHAWAQAYVAGRWEIFDTTPPDWTSVENGGASYFDSILDFFSACRFFFYSKCRWHLWDRGRYGILLIGLVPTVILLGRRLYFGMGKRRAIKSSIVLSKNGVRQGSDSPFYEIEKHLAAAGFPRNNWETMRDWLKRVANSAPTLASEPLDFDELFLLVEHHYRYRFLAEGPAHHDSDVLSAGVRHWLEQRNGAAGRSIEIAGEQK